MRISDWSSDVCSSDLGELGGAAAEDGVDDAPVGAVPVRPCQIVDRHRLPIASHDLVLHQDGTAPRRLLAEHLEAFALVAVEAAGENTDAVVREGVDKGLLLGVTEDRKSTRLNSSH